MTAIIDPRAAWLEKRGRKLLIRFLGMVAVGSDCWLWTGYRNQNGYGEPRLGGARWLAHRLSYGLFVGPIPDGMFVCHHCDVPACVRPAHLFLGTALDNNRDRSIKGRSASGDRSGARLHPEKWSRGDSHWTRQHPECLARGVRNGAHTHPEKVARGEAHWTRRMPGRQRGERNGRAKLTSAQAAEIRASVAGPTAMAREYGVCKNTILRIRAGKGWL